MLVQRRTALVVDDMIGYLRLAAQMLRRLGYDPVETALDGDIALQGAPLGTYDLLLVDQQMPRLDGTSLIRIARSDPRQAAHETPILVMTGYTDRESILALRRAGADLVLRKPFSFAQMEERIAILRDTRQLARLRDEARGLARA